MATVVDRLGLCDTKRSPRATGRVWNISPTDEHFIVTSRLERRIAQWARWASGTAGPATPSAAQVINATAETLDKLPSFREAFLRRCCVIAADGF